jgi:hypothetical protein
MNYLYHHGIKGMKWGVRRSKAQLGYKVSSKKSKVQSADDKKKADMKKASKNRRLLSDTNLKQRIERIKLEKQLKELTDEELSPGKKFIKDVLSSSGKKAATAIATGAILYAGKAAVTQNFDAREMAGYVFQKPKNK